VEVGVRELKNHLSQYLAEVAKGNEVVVTDRGRAVARITAMSGQRVFEELVANGVVAPAPAAKRSAPTARLVTTEPVSPLVAEQRR
jgi:prevent-host-death family protein